MKVRLKQRLVSKRPKESKEPNHDTSDFIWVGGFQEKTMPQKRKMNDDEEEDFSSDISSILRMLKKQLQENTMESPAKRARHSDIWQVPRQGNVDNKTSTPISQSKTLSFQSQINAFKSHFESGPDFQIYDSYTYPVTHVKGASTL